MVEDESESDTQLNDLKFGTYVLKVRLSNRSPRTEAYKPYKPESKLSEAYKPLKANALSYTLVSPFGRVRCLIDAKFSKGLVAPMRLRTTDLGLIKSIASLKIFPVARNSF